MEQNRILVEQRLSGVGVDITGLIALAYLQIVLIPLLAGNDSSRALFQHSNQIDLVKEFFQCFLTTYTSNLTIT